MRRISHDDCDDDVCFSNVPIVETFRKSFVPVSFYITRQSWSSSRRKISHYLVKNVQIIADYNRLKSEKLTII